MSRRCHLNKCERCSARLPKGRPAFVVGGMVVCRDCRDETQPLCPYCRCDLPKRPKAKTRCKSCKREMFVRRTQSRFDSTILTSEQCAELEMIERLLAFGLQSGDFDSEQTSLRGRFGREPSVNDVAWSLLGKAAIRTRFDPETMAEVDEVRADILRAEGRDPHGEAWLESRRAKHRLLLERMRQDGYCTHVEILKAPGCCDACTALPSGPMPIVEAIRLALLPCPDCENNGERGPWQCRCMYAGVY